VHKRGRGLLRRWLLPVDPKLFLDQTAAPVPEIMDGSFSNFIHFLKTRPLYKVYSYHSLINWNWNIFVRITSNNFSLEALPNKLRKTYLKMITVLTLPPSH
jgi:hypothetical protein